MSWNTIAASDVLTEFTPQEQASLNAIQGSSGNLGSILTNVIALARGNIRAGGYTLAPGSTIPDQLRLDVIAIARWRWLASLPALKSIQTDYRKEQYTEAMKRLDMVANQKINIEPGLGANAPSSNWNSENKLIGRLHPTPPPATQATTDGTTDSPYANPGNTDGQ